MLGDYLLMLPICTGTESGAGHWEPIPAFVHGKYLFMLAYRHWHRARVWTLGTNTGICTGKVFVYAAYRHWHRVTECFYNE
jgi:hypothetical protein